MIVSLLIFAGVAPCSAGTDSDTGLEPGYWETHSVLYAEVQSWTPDGGRDRSGTLVLRAYATLTGDWDCGAEPIVSALCITGHGTTVREFNLVPGARVFVALTHADDDLLVSGAAMFYMPLSACLIPVAESASRECWDYMWARLTRVRAGLPPPHRRSFPSHPSSASARSSRWLSLAAWRKRRLTSPEATRRSCRACGWSERMKPMGMKQMVMNQMRNLRNDAARKRHLPKPGFAGVRRGLDTGKR